MPARPAHHGRQQEGNTEWPVRWPSVCARTNNRKPGWPNGASLALADGAGEKKQVDQWAALGGRAFAREARQRDEGKEAIVLTFTAALDHETTTALRAAGFNKVLSTGKASRVPTMPRSSPRRKAVSWLSTFETG